MDKYFEPSIIVTFTLGLFTFIFLEIVLRPFNISIAWSGEAARFLFVWVIYLGISYAIRNGRHIRVLALVKLLPVKTQQFLNLISNLVFLSYQGIVLYHAIKITEKSFRLGQLAPAMEIPLAFLYVCLVVSAALSIIRLSITIKRDISILFNISENNAVTKQA
ncbi:MULTISPECIES: TRAP transporter small permease [Gammaproteobacteria]|uniref:TRAP transporter small permease n=1 Tax=Gammaproteobacteria TaxID=1236 RepID=UPI001C9C7EE7|nr:TRAP transporter small permease [Vibrio fluvialis]EKF9172872.1 TRAP transporter small permease [Vibrio cholerae]MBY7771316.1 TRAP transporter small permease [Vibrio fluvialis]MBY7817323.1 TRAP transporter small permease [Vibrio fluvialis]MBY8095873.1 TRAP transporter small permease [Vibrio fluvialis]MBY8185392.1 TRAP transporter small permease [Vibrio fluvialis]